MQLSGFCMILKMKVKMCNIQRMQGVKICLQFLNWKPFNAILFFLLQLISAKCTTALSFFSFFFLLLKRLTV